MPAASIGGSPGRSAGLIASFTCSSAPQASSATPVLRGPCRRSAPAPHTLQPKMSLPPGSNPSIKPVDSGISIPPVIHPVAVWDSKRATSSAAAHTRRGEDTRIPRYSRRRPLSVAGNCSDLSGPRNPLTPSNAGASPARIEGRTQLCCQCWCRPHQQTVLWGALRYTPTKRRGTQDERVVWRPPWYPDFDNHSTVMSTRGESTVTVGFLSASLSSYSGHGSLTLRWAADTLGPILNGARPRLWAR